MAERANPHPRGTRMVAAWAAGSIEKHGYAVPPAFWRADGITRSRQAVTRAFGREYKPERSWHVGFPKIDDKKGLPLKPDTPAWIPWRPCSTALDSSA
jgi:hypothetical protein